MEWRQSLRQGGQMLGVSTGHSLHSEEIVPGVTIRRFRRYHGRKLRGIRIVGRSRILWIVTVANLKTDGMSPLRRPSTKQGGTTPAVQAVLALRFRAERLVQLS